MSNGECREYAAYCLEMVGLAKTESNRMNYLDLAQAWLSVAVSQSLQNEDAERPAQLAQWQSRASSTIRWTGIGGGYMVERFYCGEVPRQVTIREGTERWPLDPSFDLHKHS